MIQPAIPHPNFHCPVCGGDSRFCLAADHEVVRTRKVFASSQAQDVANRIAAQIEHFRGIIAMMQPESRALIFRRMEAGYCRDCGKEIGDGFCQCENDE